MDVATKISIERACSRLATGGFVIVTDDAERENEGDLVLAADQVTAKHITYMLRQTSGIICVAMEQQRLSTLELPQMVSENTSRHGTAFTISVDLIEGTTTGVSAADRARTIQALVNPSTRPTELARPGHVYPLCASTGGILARPGHTEASLELVRLAGRYPAAVLCELMNEDGTMMRGHTLKQFGVRHGIEVISIHDLVEYTRRCGDDGVGTGVQEDAAAATITGQAART